MALYRSIIIIYSMQRHLKIIHGSQSVRIACDQHAVGTCCTCDQHAMGIYRTCDQCVIRIYWCDHHAIGIYCTCGQHVMCTCYTCDIQMLCMWQSCDWHMLHMWSAQNAMLPMHDKLYRVMLSCDWSCDCSYNSRQKCARDYSYEINDLNKKL